MYLRKSKVDGQNPITAALADPARTVLADLGERFYQHVAQQHEAKFEADFDGKESGWGD